VRDETAATRLGTAERRDRAAKLRDHGAEGRDELARLHDLEDDTGANLEADDALLESLRSDLTAGLEAPRLDSNQQPSG
jgi:hypothetical protein